MIAMLALLAAMTVHGHQSGGQASAADHVHAEMTTETIADTLAGCCDVADGPLHHTMSGCALVDIASAPSIAIDQDITDAVLRLARSRALPESPSDTPLRPPIAA